MTSDEILKNILLQAELALKKGDKRKAGLFINEVLKEDFINLAAWKLLHRLLGEDQPFENFQYTFAAKYYPDRLHLLITDDPRWIDEIDEDTRKLSVKKPMVQLPESEGKSSVPSSSISTRSPVQRKSNQKQGWLNKTKLIILGVILGTSLFCVIGVVLGLPKVITNLLKSAQDPILGVWTTLDGMNRVEINKDGTLVLCNEGVCNPYKYTKIDDTTLTVVNNDLQISESLNYEIVDNQLYLFNLYFYRSNEKSPMIVTPVVDIPLPSIVEEENPEIIGPSVADMSVALAPDLDGFYLVVDGDVVNMKRTGECDFYWDGIDSVAHLPVTRSPVPVILLRSKTLQLSWITTFVRFIGGVGLSMENKNGLVVVSSMANSSPDFGAIASDLRLGDAIIEINGQKINDDIDLAVSLLGGDFGEYVYLKVLRGTQELEIPVFRNYTVKTEKIPFHTEVGSGDDGFVRLIPDVALKNGLYCFGFPNNDHVGPENSQVVCFVKE